MPGGAVSQADVIAHLHLPGRWGVKDSFATLELASRGFTELFSAQWLHLAAPPVATASGARWDRIQDSRMLAAWEAAWRGPSASTPLDPAQALFRPALLEDASIAFLAASLQGSLVAGAIAYRAAGVVSMSNTFFAAGAPAELRAELTRANPGDLSGTSRRGLRARGRADPLEHPGLPAHRPAPGMAEEIRTKTKPCRMTGTSYSPAHNGSSKVSTAAIPEGLRGHAHRDRADVLLPRYPEALRLPLRVPPPPAPSSGSEASSSSSEGWRSRWGSRRRMRRSWPAA